MSNIGDITTFKGIVDKVFCNKPSFKACSVQVGEIMNGVLFKNSYGNVSIHGDFQEVQCGTEYEIEVEYEGENNYGHQYKVIRISIPRPNTPEQVRSFLSEFISPKRAEVITKAYPNIIDMVLKGETIDVSKLTGIGEKSLEQIKEKIIDNIGVLDLHKEYGEFGLSFSILRKILREYKSVDNAIFHIKKDPYDSLTKINGIGFLKADEIALKINPNFLCSIERMRGCILYYLKQNEQKGHTYADYNMLYSDCMSHVEESICYFNLALNCEDLYYNETTKRVARKIMRDRELYIAQSVLEVHNSVKKWDIDVEKYRQLNNGCELTDEQLEVLSSVCEHGVTCLIGAGGMGKSASIERLVAMLEDNNKTYKLMTPTAKSAEVLADFTGRHAKTAHRHMGYNGSSFETGEDNLIHTDVIIFDEFSMVDIWLFVALLKSIDFKKTRLVLVGDSWQLPSIGAGNLLHDISTSGVINVVQLTKVFRYGEGGLAKVVEDLRNGFTFLPNNFIGKKVFGANKDFCYVELEQEYMVDTALNFFKRLLDSGNSLDDIAIITSKKVGKYGTIVINKAVQKMLQDGSNESMVINNNLTLFVGDKVRQTKNNYHVRIAYRAEEGYEIDEEEDEEISEEGEVSNGQTGIITEIDNEKKLIYISFKGTEYVYKKDSIYDQIDLGYASTAHSTQGASINYVISIIPRADTFMLSNNLLYTPWSRTRKRCYVLGNIYTINKAIKINESLIRNTFLKEFLISLANGEEI